jgi:hypothetical protein
MLKKQRDQDAEVSRAELGFCGVEKVEDQFHKDLDGLDSSSAKDGILAVMMAGFQSATIHAQRRWRMSRSELWYGSISPLRMPVE